MEGRPDPDQPEAVNEPRTEERVLAHFGYEHCLDAPVFNRDGSIATREDGSIITGRNFLDAYGEAADSRQEAADIIGGFLDMDPTDPAYADSRAYVGIYLSARFGTPAR